MFLKVYVSAKSWFLKYKQGLLQGLHNKKKQAVKILNQESLKYI